MKTKNIFQYLSVALLIFTLSISFNFTASAEGKRPVRVNCYSPSGTIQGYATNCPSGSGNCVVNACSTRPSIDAE